MNSGLPISRETAWASLRHCQQPGHTCHSACWNDLEPLPVFVPCSLTTSTGYHTPYSEPHMGFEAQFPSFSWCPAQDQPTKRLEVCPTQGWQKVGLFRQRIKGEQWGCRQCCQPARHRRSFPEGSYPSEDPVPRCFPYSVGILKPGHSLARQGTARVSRAPFPKCCSARLRDPIAFLYGRQAGVSIAS